MNVIMLPTGKQTRAVAEMTMAERLASLSGAGFLTPAEAARLDTLRDASYVLVRNDGSAGERWRCGRCGAKHAHFTLFCVERPFRGLLDGLHAYWANVGARAADLSPGQRQRLDVLASIFGSQPTALATAHPATAAGLATDETDVLIGSTVLGSLDPITPQRARLLMETINMRARQRVLTL